MVIPGTDKNSKLYCELASAMGLKITHHHAEPLGAEMFARAYPGRIPSYNKYPAEFQALWKEAIRRQIGRSIVWNLGFRGQGDCPFWNHDPQIQTDQERGELISRIIRIQYDMVKQEDPNAVCSTNLYGEIMELYQKGCLNLPEEVIKIWADNGYGKMVSRRQENSNPRIPALPSKDQKGKHGIYYHVSFYDLQAANHITMLSNSPEFVRQELLRVLTAGADDYWIINCSNVKPHIYYLDLIARMWRDGDVDITAHLKEYIITYYGAEHWERIAECLKHYWDCPPLFGNREDEHAGEQFSNHPARILITQYIKNKEQPAGELLWAVESDSLSGQIAWYGNLCRQAGADYETYKKECAETLAALEGKAAMLFQDSIMLQARIQSYCYNGAFYVCRSLLNALEDRHQIAFYYAGKARKNYLKANEAMRSREHGKWRVFYKNECLTDVKQTAYVLEGLMAYERIQGDGPHFYSWQREFLYAEEDRRVALVMNMENHLKDEELFELMEEKWDE